MGKVLFFDIDGTLVPFRSAMPESTVRALKKAKANGHKLVICSGRARCQMQKELSVVDFDGYVLESGAYIEDNGKVIFRHIIESAELEMLIDVLDKADAAYICQTDKGTVTSPHCVEGLKSFNAAMGGNEETMKQIFFNLAIDEDISKRHDIEKVVYHNASVPFDEIKEKLADKFEFVGLSFETVDPYSAEITAKGIHKASGMERYLKHCGLSREDSFAFGDGPNDFEMIEYAGCGVVMGNGLPELKQRADYITASIDDDGIEKALQHFGLI